MAAVSSDSTLDTAGPGEPFHAGERAMQMRTGVRERMELTGPRVIRDRMPDQHRELFEQLPFMLVGSLDASLRPWASIVVGWPGFVRTPDARTLAIYAHPGYGDPLGVNLVVGAPVGLLGIQLETRRRNRVNGTVVEVGAGGFAVEVRQSFGNCPKYIQAREPIFVADPSTMAEPRLVRAEGAVLSADAVALVRCADTFFITTASRAARDGRFAEGLDISHRGGKPGFVRVTKEDGYTVLTAPDFVGNFYFNTLGNIAANPRAGLLFIDFASGGVLSLTGEAEVVWDGSDLASFVGAQRLLRFRVAEGVVIANAVPLRWSAPEPAPQLAATGSWDTAP